MNKYKEALSVFIQSYEKDGFQHSEPRSYVLDGDEVEAIKQALQDKIDGGWKTDPTLVEEGEMVLLMWKDGVCRVGYRGEDLCEEGCDFINEYGEGYSAVEKYMALPKDGE